MVSSLADVGLRWPSLLTPKLTLRVDLRTARSRTRSCVRWSPSPKSEDYTTAMNGVPPDSSTDRVLGRHRGPSLLRQGEENACEQQNPSSRCHACESHSIALHGGLLFFPPLKPSARDLGAWPRDRVPLHSPPRACRPLPGLEGSRRSRSP